MSNAISDNAICLRRWDFSETSQTVALLTREHGLIRGLAKGAKRPKSRFSGGFDLLTRGQVLAIIKKSSELALLTEWHLEQVYRTPRRVLHANRIGLFMADLVLHFLDEHDPHPRTFDALATALDGVEAAGTNEASMVECSAWLLRFHLTLLRDVGYQPQLHTNARTGKAMEEQAAIFGFSPTAGGIVVDDGQEGVWRVRARTIELLRHADALRDDSGAAALNALHTTHAAEDFDRANRLLAAYARELLGRQLPSFAWIFPDLVVGRNDSVVLANQSDQRATKRKD